MFSSKSRTIYRPLFTSMTQNDFPYAVTKSFLQRLVPHLEESAGDEVDEVVSEDSSSLPVEELSVDEIELEFVSSSLPVEELSVDEIEVEFVSSSLPLEEPSVDEIEPEFVSSSLSLEGPSVLDEVESEFVSSSFPLEEPSVDEIGS